AGGDMHNHIAAAPRHISVAEAPAGAQGLEAGLDLLLARAGEIVAHRLRLSRRHALHDDVRRRRGDEARQRKKGRNRQSGVPAKESGRSHAVLVLVLVAKPTNRRQGPAVPIERMIVRSEPLTFYSL